MTFSSEKNSSRYLLAGLVALLTLAVYLPVLWCDFVNWDDTVYVLNNLHIRTLNGDFLWWAFTDMSKDYWLPLAWISHAFDYALWGLNPAGHHLTSLLLHSLNTFLVVMLVIRLLAWRTGTPDVPFESRFLFVAAGATGVLFGLHPLHVESVAWVAERKDLLCALFFLLSVLAYVRYAAEGETKGTHALQFLSSKYYYATLILFMLALASKPMSVTLPAVLLLLDWYPFRRIRSWAALTPVLLEKLPFIALSLLASLVAVQGQEANGNLIPLASWSVVDRIFSATGALMFYLGKMAAPLHLLPFYPSTMKTSNPSFLNLVALAGVCGITAACVIFVNRSRLALAVWFYYVITLLPVLGLVRVGSTVVADRFTYLPSLGPFLLAGMGLAWAGMRTGHLGFATRRWFAGLAVVLVMVLSVATVKQIAVWRNSLNLWDHVIEHEPDRVPLAYNNRGLALQEKGELDRAIADYTAAIALNPVYGHPYTNRGMAFDATGDLDRAMTDLDRAVALEPGYADGFRHRGQVLRKKGKFAGAAGDFTQALNLRPGDVTVYVDRALTFRDLGQFDRAIADLTTAVTLHPTYADAYVHRGMVYKIMKQYDRAIEDYTTAITIKPSSVEAYNNRGVAYKHLSQFDRALADYDRAIELDPAFSLAYMNRGMLYVIKNNIGEAVREFRKACELGNDDGCNALRSY